MKKFIFLTLIGVLLSSPFTFAQNLQFKPDGINGSLGAGFVEFTVKQPSSQFTLDQGVYGSAAGEKGFDFMNLYLTISLNYLQTEGQARYQYSTLSGLSYDVLDTNFKVQVFQPGLGLKFKVIDAGFFKPYVEGGGLFDFFQIDYTDLRSRITAGTNTGTAGINTTDAKYKDTLFNFSKYAEAGVEIAFAESFGVKAAMRYIASQTRGLDTLNDQVIDLESRVFYFSLLKAF